MALYRVIIVLWLVLSCAHRSSYSIFEEFQTTQPTHEFSPCRDFLYYLLDAINRNEQVTAVVKDLEGFLIDKRDCFYLLDFNPLEAFLENLESKKIKMTSCFPVVPIIQCFLSCGYGNISQNCDPNVLRSLAKIMLADVSNRFVSILVEGGFDVNMRNSHSGEGLFHCLVRESCVLLKNHNLVHIALYRTLNYLLKQGMAIHVVNKAGCNPLHIAIQWLESIHHKDEIGTWHDVGDIECYLYNYLNLVQVLLDHGVRVYDMHFLNNVADNRSLFYLIKAFFYQAHCANYPLRKAIEKTGLILLEQFITHVQCNNKWSVNAKDLYLNQSCTGKFCRDGLNTPKYISPLSFTCMLRAKSWHAYDTFFSLEFVKILLRHGANPAFRSSCHVKSLLYQAVESSDIALVEEFLKYTSAAQLFASPYINHKKCPGHTALHIAIKQDDLPMIRFLYANNYVQKEHLDIPNKAGETPWLLAISPPIQQEIVDILIKIRNAG